MALMDVKEFAVECSGPNCRPDRRGRRRVLGIVTLDEGGQIAWEQERRTDLTGWWEGMRLRIPRSDRGDYYRVVCDRCQRAWVFTVHELTEKHGRFAAVPPAPVAIAGRDVGGTVGAV
jgi:hypothetical protein